MQRTWIGVTMIFLLAGRVALAGEGSRDLRQVARRTAANPLADIADRKAAVWILSRGPNTQDDDLRCLADLLTPQTPLELQLAAVEALSRSPHPGVSKVLLSNWTQHGPKVHAAVVAVLLWREPWLGVLEEEAARRPELAAALDWARRDVALRHPVAEVRVRAEEVRVRPTTQPDIRKSLDRFLPALRIQGDAIRGRKVFNEATCANCHKVEDVGRHVGPDLSRLVDRSPRSLLVDTIDPNRVVDHRFIEYSVVTTNGRQISGMLFDETGDRLMLADLKGELQLVLRKDLDELVSHHRSQMPEGLEANCSLQQMADLIAFLASCRGLREVDEARTRGSLREPQRPVPGFPGGSVPPPTALRSLARWRWQLL